MNKTGITFFGGVNEISGSKILLQDKDMKIFLGFGLEFHQIHASGHCSSRDLAKVINRMQPKN